MKVQLFVPPGGYLAERWSQGSSMPPLGVLMIAAVLEKEGIDLDVVPADVLKMSWTDVRRRIRDFRADIIGVTSTTENRFQSFRLLRLAKKTRPAALTVLGGPHASMAAEDSLLHIPQIDLAVRGEGEFTMIDICRSFERKNDVSSLADVAGITLRVDGRVVSNRPRPAIADLDGLPFPAFHLIPFDRYNFRVEVPGHGPLPAVNIMTSRGCPFNCNFCATPVNWGRHVRNRSPRNVVDEIEFHIREHGARVIFFYDDTFNTSVKRVEEICDLILERNLRIFWRAEVRLDLMSKDLLAKMKRAGLFHVSFGLEAGSERVRTTIIDKKISTDDFHRLVAWCRELDVIPNAFFIVSHPTETWEEAQETIRIIEQTKDQIEATIAVLHVYPGTPLERTAKELGVIPRDFSWTKKRVRGIITLPTAQGDVPLFLDKLSWFQISEILFRWASSGGRISILRKIPRLLANIRSFGDIKRYAVMALVFFRLRMKRVFKNKPR